MAKTKAKKKPQKKVKGKKGKGQSKQPQLSPQEQAALKRKQRVERKKLNSVITISAIAVIVLGFPLLLIKPLLGIAAIAGIPTLYVSYQYPRTALWLFVIYLPFSGTIQYQLLGGNPLFSLAKDGFFIPACIALYQECKKQKLPIVVSKKLLITLSILIACSILTLFVVNGMMQFLPTCGGSLRKGCKDGIPFAQGILGLKVFVGYVPLIFCAYYLVDSKKKLLWLGRLHVVLAIICTSLGVVQYALLYIGICKGTRDAVGVDLFKASIEAKCFIGGALTYSPSQGQIRLPGTLPSPWHWAWFLISNSAITFTTAFSDTSIIWRLAGLLGMGLVFVNAVISGQRIALALVPVVTIILLILTGQIANIKRFLPIGLGLAVVIGIAVTLNPALVEERLASFQSRAEASPPQQFIMEQFAWAIEKQKGLLGRGLGKATNSTRVFGEAQLVETFHPKILYETGWPGLIAFLAFMTNIVVTTFQSYRSCKDKVLRSFGSSFWVFILIISYFPYWYPLDTDPVCVYYWFFVGVVLKLPQLDKDEQEKLKSVQDEELEMMGKKAKVSVPEPEPV